MFDLDPGQKKAIAQMLMKRGGGGSSGIGSVLDGLSAAINANTIKKADAEIEAKKKKKKEPSWLTKALEGIT